jgi:branched-chain amino acid transport system permease protein
MEVFLAQLINGLAVGSMYALVVTGFNLLLLVSGVVQYAYAHIVVISMYIAWTVLQVTGENLILSILAAIFCATIISMLTEPLFRPLTKKGAINQTFVMSIGLAMIFTHIMAKHFHRGMPISFPERLAGHKAAIQFGVAAISTGQLYTFFGTIFAVATFMYLLYWTMTGKAFRAMAQSPFIARLLGIPIIKMGMISYGIAGLLGGVTAVFLAMALGSAYPVLGDLLGIKVIATVLFAGIGNLKGGLICGLILGVAESLTMGYLPGQWSDAVAFGMIMVAVMFKPEGIFGTRA